MDNCTIEYVDTLPKVVEEKMEKGFVEYETSQGIDVNYKRFSFILRECNGNAIGVLNAYTAFAEVYVDDIWIDQASRGKGYGKRLLLELENHFKNKGFNNINLVTSAFQAPGFYKKCGFIEEFTRINKKNPMFTKTFFVKYFEDEVQTQGILTNSIMMHKNREKFKAIKKWGLPIGQYAITGSGALGIRNLKEIGDIDIIVSSQLWDALAAKFGVTIDTNIKKIIFPDGIVEALGEHSFAAEQPDVRAPTLTERIATAEIIEGLPFETLENVLYYKRKMNREKDLNDILLIEKILSE